MPAPTFTFGGANVAEPSGGKKKILLGIASVVVVGALLYAGQNLLGGHPAAPASQPVASSKPAVLPAPTPSAPAAAETSKTAAAVAEVGNNEELRRWLENLNDEDLGRYKM